MSLSLSYRPEVRDEIDDAYQWYEGQRTGLGDEFLDAIQGVIRNIEQHPRRYAFVLDDIRCHLAVRFPYAVYYRIDVTSIRILAVQHTRRDPGGWQQRK